MNGHKYRLELDISKRTNVTRGPSGSYDHLFITKTDQPAEAEAMLHGLTLPQLVRDVRAFHEKFKVPAPVKPTGLSHEDLVFRAEFLKEEFLEFTGAKCLEDQLDALVDLVYVAIGTAIWAGWDFEEAWRRVQKANMQKMLTPSAGASKRGHALDVIKPAWWVAPDLSDLVK